jgi:hypothetical protein
MENLTGIKAASQNIAACLKSTANARAQMVAEMARKLGKRTKNGKSTVHAVDATYEIAAMLLSRRC